MPETRASSTTAGKVYLDTDGQLIPLSACTLPEIKWAIKEIPAGSTTPGGTTLIGEMRIGDLEITFSPALMSNLADWVDEIMHGKRHARDLQIVRTDPLGKVQERIMMIGCTLTELRFPECNASSGTPYLVSAVIKPETLTSVSSGETNLQPVNIKPKHWLTASFTISVDGLPTRFVRQVGGFTLKRQFASKLVGEQRIPATYVGMGHCTPLSLQLGSTDYHAWRDFAFQQIATGAGDKQLAAVLELRDATLKNSLGAFHFTLAGLTGFNFEPVVAGAEPGSRLSATASLAVSNLSLHTPL
jgi:hypothetical protein